LMSVKIIYILMILTIDHGWEIAQLRGNPYDTMESCNQIYNIISIFSIIKLHDTYFYDVRCVRREVRD